MNPFTLVYDALWTLVNNSVLMRDLVKQGNRITFNESNNRDIIKQVVQAGDLPELILVTEGCPIVNLQSTSSSSMLVRRYSWLLSTGDLRLNAHLHPIEWSLFCALADWKTTLSSLVYEGNTFVKRVAYIDVSVGQSVAEQNRNIKGWSALWRCEVEMHFKTQLLKDISNGNT